MTANIVTQNIVPLPRDTDVEITLTRAEAEIATDMSLLVFCTPNVENLPPNNGRFIIGSTANALNDAAGWGPSDTGYWAVNAWSSQSSRPRRMAVGKIFESPVQAQLMAASLSNFAEIRTVSNGSLAIDLTDNAGIVVAVSLENMDFTAVTGLSSVVAVINGAIADASADSVLSAAVEYGGRLTFTASADQKAVSFAFAGATGDDVADVSAMLGLTQETGAQKWDHYEPKGIVDEVKLIQTALAAAGAKAFVVALDAKYRDTEDQRLVADYIESQFPKMAGTFCTNSPTAFDAADMLNICAHIKNNGHRTNDAVYSSHPQQYPDIAYPQAILSTDYIGGTTKTAKFKSAAGITPESLTETQWQILNSRNCNAYTRVGNNADYFREGKQGADTWFTDSYYGWANFIELAQVAILNGLIRRPKTILENEGAAAVFNDLSVVCQQFTTNKFLGPREEYDATLNVPYITRKPYEIIQGDIHLSNRETRTLSPFSLIAYEAGAIHKAVVNINAWN